MKILILGASGKTGRLVVEQAMARGYEVVGLSRHLQVGEPRKGLLWVAGDASVAADIRSAAQGCDAVVSALGHTSTKPSRVQTEAAKALAAGLSDGTPVVSLTGFGVPDPSDPAMPPLGKLMTAAIKAVPGGMYQDGADHVAVLRASGLRWTVIRAPRLSQGQPTGYRLGHFSLTGFAAVSRADVATAMLDCLESDEWARRAPMIQSARGAR